ncbi:tRNA pseudouridine(13) synthase TruD [Kineobactrum sediminis]|uniref:tRNA pseudouridine synthase D n=1 Tax=Kineobactrum sediminis TaxID=1905677 RepID=A0A2N5Y1N2_9GAMM|nr:tRNA pseudouridine(13) synthase TruD [Kineobactrum sediminis]PLW82300.1 tRNA pseudouridine(13) synthase TruD [Kineobactrum sediminis]
MSNNWPRVSPVLPARGVLRSVPEDFVVREQLGFEPEGEGEHVFLHLQKRGLNTQDLLQRVSGVSGIHLRDIGYSGLKDRNAVTSQWVSVRMAGREEPDWQRLASQGDIDVLACARHTRKLKRGVHRSNHFELRLRKLEGDLAALEQRLQLLRQHGVPNYFGEQRFGRGGSTLVQARQWQQRDGGGRKLSHNQRSLLLSALRGQLFNTVLAQRVREGTWDRILAGDVCMLQGSRSLFSCTSVDADIEARAASGDIHPGLPLWGRGRVLQAEPQLAQQAMALAEETSVCRFLESAGLALAYRSARLLPDDFNWQFCDDGSLLISFSLAPGSYATAVLAELIEHREGYQARGNGSE